MARPGVTYLEVANAALEITATGKHPTIEAIRALLGSGSNSTLGTHLRNWKLRQDQTQKIASKEKLPEELVSILKGLWDKVMNEADAKIQGIHEAAQNRISTLELEITQQQESIRNSLNQYQTLQQERNGLLNDKAALEEVVVQSNLNIATMIEKLTNLERQVSDKEIRIEELHQQNRQVQANLEHYRAATLEQRMAEQQRHEHQQQEFEKTVRELSQLRLVLQQERNLFQQQNQQMQLEYNNLRAEMEKLQIQFDLLTSHHSEIVLQIEKKTQEQCYWQDQFQAQKSLYEEQNKALVNFQIHEALASHQLERLSSELKNSEDRNKQLAHEKWILGQEKAQLFGQLRQLELSL